MKYAQLLRKKKILSLLPRLFQEISSHTGLPTIHVHQMMQQHLENDSAYLTPSSNAKI